MKTGIADLRIDYPFQPGQRVELLLDVERDLTVADLGTIQGTLAANGMHLLGAVDIGSGPWPNTLRLRFQYPAAHEVGALPLAVLLVLALGTVGIAGFLGWKVGNILTSVGNYIVPITLIVGGIYVLGEYAKRSR